MKYVLMLLMLSGHGATSQAVVYPSEAACDAAKKHYEQTLTFPGRSRAFGSCAPLDVPQSAEASQ